MTSLAHALLDRAGGGRGKVVFHLPDERVVLGVADLAERALRAAAWLDGRGVGVGSRVGVLGPNRPEWAVWTFATWAVGAAVVPIQVPLRLADRDAFTDRIRSLVDAAGCDVVLCDPALAWSVAPELAAPWTEPAAAARQWTVPALDAASPAVLQFTSGSTSAPKGAVVSHAAVLAQAEALAAESTPDPADEVMAGWAPFFHDLGLFLHVVHPFLNGPTVELLPTEQFARDPGAWLRLASSTRSTGAVAPASAWSAALRALGRRGDAVDLSAMEIAVFAAEATDPDFVDRMLSLCPELHLRPEALTATYGLAEAVMGVTQTPRDQPLQITSFDRDLLATEGLAVEAPAGRGRRIVSSGRPMRGFELRISSDGAPLPDARVGEVQLRGASTMSGYLGGADHDAVDSEGWLRTGDLGFTTGGQLYVVGRAKDVLIVGGSNYHPEDFEWAAGRVDGVRAGRSVAFMDAARERLVLVVEPEADTDPEALGRTVRHAVADAVGVPPSEVVVVPPGTVEKTTSGKLRRQAMRARHLAMPPPV